MKTRQQLHGVDITNPTRHVPCAQAWAGDAGAGESIFSGNCAACHAGGQNVIQPEKTLQQAVRGARWVVSPSMSALCVWRLTPPPHPQALSEYLDGGANEKAVIKQVTNGKNAMPAFGGRLSDEDIANVATYVITTAKAGWD